MEKKSQQPLPDIFNQHIGLGMIMCMGFNQAQWWEILEMLPWLLYLVASRKDGSCYVDTAKNSRQRYGPCTWFTATHDTIEGIQRLFLQHISWSARQTLNHCVKSAGSLLPCKTITWSQRRILFSKHKVPITEVIALDIYRFILT